MNEYIEISGIKCDTHHCNYEDRDVKFKDYEKWLNKPCPVCGRNLLTQSEYDKCLLLIKRFEKIQKVLHDWRWINPMFYINILLGRKPKMYERTYNFPDRKV